MKSVLVISKLAGLAEAVRCVLDPGLYRVIHQSEAPEAALSPSTVAVVDACVLDADLDSVDPIRVIRQILRFLPGAPVIVYCSKVQWEWEEEAYTLGVQHVLNKPVRGGLLNVLLERQWKIQSPPERLSAVRSESEKVGKWESGAGAVQALPAHLRPRCVGESAGSFRSLEATRRFSAILTHSLRTDSLLKEFLMLLREMIGVNRSALFLRQPAAALPKAHRQREERHLRCACALGLPPTLLEHFELSLESGIGRYLFRFGRILRSASEDSRYDLEMQKEFELLGVQIAIPILDRESLIGIAVFDGRMTGEPFSNEELELIFHLLEELGLAVRNSWLHEELVGNDAMMSEILNQLGGGCVVIGRNLAILHANNAAMNFFCANKLRGLGMDFSDLPPVIGSKVFEVLKTGFAKPAFKFRTNEGPIPLPSDGSGRGSGRGSIGGDRSGESVFEVIVTPFRHQNAVTANAVLLLIEDVTQSERAQRLELEASKLRLIQSMSEQLAHEIGNSLVPLSTLEQLMERGSLASQASAASPPPGGDSEVLQALGGSLTSSVRRISRFSEQMLFLSRSGVARRENAALPQLLNEAFEKARGVVGLASESGPILQVAADVSLSSVSGEIKGLRHAFAEILLNAIQAAPAAAKIIVTTYKSNSESGREFLNIRIEDGGPGFTPQTARSAIEPFFSTKTVGLGLGLAVSQKIFETHEGKLEIRANNLEKHGVVVVSLPFEAEG